LGRHAAHRVEKLLELPQSRRAYPHRSFPRGQPFEDRADRIELQQFLSQDLPDNCAAKRRTLNEPKDVEIAQRFAYRRLTDGELFGDARLDDPIARSEAAVEDVVNQLVANLLAKDTALAAPCSPSNTRHIPDRRHVLPRWLSAVVPMDHG